VPPRGISWHKTKEVEMTRIGKRQGSLVVAVAVAVVAGLTATLLVTRSGNASGANMRAVVKVMRNATLGKRILVTANGRTLYSLSAEGHGRFICTTTACVSLWKPLTVPSAVKPSGVNGLATVKRPNGKPQVAYRGAPLYRFVEDEKTGDVEGNGFRDVGVWRPVTVNDSATPAPARSSYSY